MDPGLAEERPGYEEEEGGAAGLGLGMEGGHLIQLQPGFCSIRLYSRPPQESFGVP